MGIVWLGFMKITHIEAIPLVRKLEDVFQGGTYKITSRNTIVTRVELDNGIVGETFGGDEDQYQLDVCRIVNEIFRPMLAGGDVRNVEEHWERMWATRIDLNNRGIHTLDLAKHCVQTQAIAAADIALWDALGKSLKQPVIRDGLMFVPDGPGFGLPLRNDTIEKWRAR